MVWCYILYMEKNMRSEQIRFIMENEATLSYISTAYEDNDKKNMLIIIQDLDLNGANVVLLELLKAYNHNTSAEWNFWVIAPTDGEFAEKLTRIGASVFVRKNVYCDSAYREFLQQSFEIVFLNTSSVHYYSTYFVNCETKVIWWFHESEDQLRNSGGVSVHPALLGDNFKICSVTKRVQNGLQTLYGINSAILPMAVNDCKEKEFNSDAKVTFDSRDEVVKFFIPAAYTYIKGQDILLEAIATLPEEYRRKSQFIFAGYHLPKQEEYYRICKEMSEKLSNVVFSDALDRDDVFRLYNECDCVVAPSRVDSTPTTIVEAMMFEKICLVSSGAGISEVMQDCQSGFVFENQNVEELVKRLYLIISDRDALSSISINGRKIYEDIFESKKVVGTFSRIIDELIEG